MSRPADGLAATAAGCVIAVPDGAVPAARMAPMALTPEEARVLACLVEKESTVPDSYPLTLNALRLACNQSSNRYPIVAYEDRVVEAALLSLKSIGLVRFVHPSHGGRTIRYRHIAGERWHLEHNELAVLALLALRGPQTASELRSRVERQLEADGRDRRGGAGHARRPESGRLRREAGAPSERARIALGHLLSGEVDESTFAPPPPDPTGPLPAPPPGRDDRHEELAAEVAALRRRLDRLEELLGVEPADENETSPPIENYSSP